MTQQVQSNADIQAAMQRNDAIHAAPDIARGKPRLVGKTLLPTQSVDLRLAAANKNLSNQQSQ